MKNLVHNVLGTPYKVTFGEREEIKMPEEYQGECRVYAKEILVCTDRKGCNDEELTVKLEEILAHEVLHAYLNESGFLLEEEQEERLADFFMKNWRKMSNSILDILDEMELSV